MCTKYGESKYGSEKYGGRIKYGEATYGTTKYGQCDDQYAAFGGGMVGVSGGCETGRIRVLLGISGVEVADTLGELETDAAKPAFGVVEYTRDGGMNTFQGGGGANGLVAGMGSAARILFPSG